MPEATLLDVYSAAFDAVDALGPTGAGSFVVVTEFGGELSQETIAQATDSRFPAALVAFEAEDPNTSESFDVTTREMSPIARTGITVYVVAESIRGHATLYRGHGDAKGLLALVGDVTGALNGLEIAGLWGTGRVHYVGARPIPSLWRPGNTGGFGVVAVRFVAERSAEQADLTAETDELHQFDGEVNPLDADATLDASALPLSTVRAEDLHD